MATGLISGAQDLTAATPTLPLDPLTANAAATTPSNVAGNLSPVSTTVAPGQAVGYDPSQRAVNPTTDTVQGQIGGIIAADSPLMQGARTRASQTAQQRGLLNTSMANQAGEMATYAAALPIAQQDATIYSDAANRNLDARNASLQFSGNAQNQFGQIAAQGEQTRQSQQMAGSIEAGLIPQREAASRETQVALQTLRGTQAQDLANIEASYKTLMQTNDSAGKVFMQTMDSINKILTSNMTVEAKQAAIDAQNQQLQNGLSVIGKISNIPDLQNLLTFSTPLPAAVGGSGAPAAAPDAAAPPPLGGAAQGLVWNPATQQYVNPNQFSTDGGD